MKIPSGIVLSFVLLFGAVAPLSAQYPVTFEKELVVTNLGVVNDATRTSGCGAWTFCGLMTSMAGANNPATMTRSWLNLWLTTYYVNGYPVNKLTRMQDVINYWPKLANGDLDLTRAPFRLLAIVNRSDLRNPGMGDAGEARFVFGLLDQYSRPRAFTVIFEYKMKTSVLTEQQWITAWHNLDAYTLGSADYNAALQNITDTFARTPVGPQVALSQLRTSDGAVCPGSNCFWEWREFYLSSGNLLPTTTKQTPHGSFNNTTTLRDYINNNEAAILAGTHVVSSPLVMTGNAGPAGWSASGIRNPQARFQFSMATCGGCHVMETDPYPRAHPFNHIQNRESWNEAQLSEFFSTNALEDMDGNLRVHDERGRRVSLFDSLLQAYGVWTGGAPAWQGYNAAVAGSMAH